MTRIYILKNIFLKYKLQLAVTYVLFIIEMLGLLLRPYFLGEAVNDLIAGKYEGLIYLVSAHLIWLVAGTFRHMFDTRTYSAIYTDLVTNLLLRRNKNTEVSKLSAHSTLAREFVDFLEFDLYYIIEAIYNLLGSLILLFFYDKMVVLVCLSVLIPVSIISFFYGKKMQRLNKLKNDELEQQVNVITENNTVNIKAHYQNLRKWQIKISDKEAWNFGIMEIMVLIVITISLLITVNQSTHIVLAGDIIGIYNYVLKFVTGIDTIPYSVQRFASLKDIMKRVEVVDEN